MAYKTGSLSSTSQSVTWGGSSPPVLHLFGTWSGTILWEHSFDGTNWVTVNSYTANNSGDQAKNSDGTFRVRFSSYTSGTATVNIGDSEVC